MKTWTLLEIQNHVHEIFQRGIQEPQLVYDQNTPVAVILDIGVFQELTATRQRQNFPTIAELLDELEQIQQEEPVELELPSRQDRPNPFIEVLYGLSV
jgi:hypothetical protein